ncbi:response regulator transcription factor [Sphingomonas sp. CJ20]
MVPGTLPCDPYYQAIEANSGDTRPVSNAEKSMVAIVEDDESVRLSVSALVRSYGFKAACFASAEDYLASPSVAETGCLVTDIEMPGMGGFALVEALGARGVLPPVVMVSATTDPALAGRARDCGARGFLRKPFPAAALIAHLEAAIGTAAAE